MSTKTFLGADFVDEGRRAGDWVVQQYASAPGPVNIVQLEGTTGADPAIDRTPASPSAIAANPNLKDRSPRRVEISPDPAASR